ncbi:MAG: DUF4296 domain-containing protein [Microscillaceae bacterium]|nr:DUF4296 domain-containing protein [Microscillaceae bacterium]
MKFFKKYLPCLFVFTGLVACAHLEEDSSGIYPKEKMIQVLTDIHLAEGRIEASGYRNIDSARADYKKQEEQIFKKHKLDTAKYRRSFVFYSENIASLSEIYTVIHDSLQIQDSLFKIAPGKPGPPVQTQQQSKSIQGNSLKPLINRKKLSDLKTKRQN